MSFFDQLGLDKVVNDESANTAVGNFARVNGGTNAIGVIHSAKWVPENIEFQTKAYINVKFKLTNTSFEGSFVDFKCYLYDDDMKKRQRTSNLFSRLYLLCGVQPAGTLPTDVDLAQFTGKLVGVEIAYWCQQGANDGIWRDGNWINALHSAQGYLPVEGTEVPKDINALNMPTQQSADQQSSAPKQAVTQTPPATQQAAGPSGGGWG